MLRLGLMGKTTPPKGFSSRLRRMMLPTLPVLALAPKTATDCGRNNESSEERSIVMQPILFVWPRAVGLARDRELCTRRARPRYPTRYVEAWSNRTDAIKAAPEGVAQLNMGFDGGTGFSFRFAIFSDLSTRWNRLDAQHRAGRLANDRFGHTAHQQPAQSCSAVRAHDDHVAIGLLRGA